MPQVVLSHEEDRARRVLDMLKRHRGLSDRELAARCGWTNHTMVHNRRTGVTRIGLGDLERLTAALEVPRDVFFMEPSDAVRWVLDNAPELTTVGALQVQVLNHPACITADSTSHELKTSGCITGVSGRRFCRHRRFSPDLALLRPLSAALAA